MIKQGFINGILTIRNFIFSIFCIFLSIFLVIFSFLKSFMTYAQFTFGFSFFIIVFSRANIILTGTHQLLKGFFLIVAIFLFTFLYGCITSFISMDDIEDSLERIVDTLMEAISYLTSQISKHLSGKSIYFLIINFSFYISRLFFYVLSLLCRIAYVLLPGTYLLVSLAVIKRYSNILNFTNTTVYILSIMEIIATVALGISLIFVGIDIREFFTPVPSCFHNITHAKTIPASNSPTTDSNASSPELSDSTEIKISISDANFLYKLSSINEALQLEIDQLNHTIQELSHENKELQAQNEQLKQENFRLCEEVSMLHKPSSFSDSSATKSQIQYSAFQKGTFNEPRDFFDSPQERILEGYLDEICKKHQLGKRYGIRLLAHQPLGNYTLEKPGKDGVNKKNKLMHFDFLFEIRKNRDGESPGSQRGHFPLLAIELDGKTHNNPKQKELDEYKDGVCQKLGISIIHIVYDEEHFSTDIINQYESAIIRGIIDAAHKCPYIDTT